ncbi:protein SMAX1-LIKE 3-like [Aegilops tauschii subsp. strangulata]|uniref:protein SMAX1-LIKE 3-like n=1 Tax=Aegilops tauschii subsp. strangulata TaxID=200361 RepID=UPI001ABC882F|nr:protein SMAX1-LIKE 3-like [Aegilops tauschii subsp. strangulata]
MRAAGFWSSQSQVGATMVGAAVSWEQPIRASCDVPKLQPSVVAHVVPDGSECQASKAKSGTAQPAFLCGTEVILPPWLHRYKCTKYTSTTYCGASLQANSASCRPKFTELTAQNLKILCGALELRVPRHANIIPGISSTVLRCRSGVTRRRAGVWPTTWLLFRGRDSGGKTAVARELARLVFGSYAEFTTLQVQGNPDIPAQTGKLALKRQRSPDIDGEGNGGDVRARLFEAIVENPHRVILIDGVNRLDGDSEMRIKNAIAGGTIARGYNDDMVGLEDAIVVLSSDVCDSRSVASASSQRVKRRRNNADMEVRPRRGLYWDLNICAVDGEEEEDSLAHDEGVISVVDGVFLFN